MKIDWSSFWLGFTIAECSVTVLIIIVKTFID